MSGKFSSFLIVLAYFLVQMTSCTAQISNPDTKSEVTQSAQMPLRTGAEQMTKYLPLLQDKKVAMLVNQTSIVPDISSKNIPLVDSLISAEIDIRFLMAPEHGLKGILSAGATVGDARYGKLQDLQVYSLYGKNKKPQSEWLDSVDCVVFDIQDVGCRFYTYLSTLYYLLEACGETGTDVIILDRPNPQDTIDGPVLEPKFQSFVGMVPVPLLHGCTLGELAMMMKGEGWVKTVKSYNLTVIPCQGWKHGDDYSLPVAPSPNLRTDHAIRIYPSLCLFEATDISVGRGTDCPFEVLGHPQMNGEFTFTPQHCESATHPLQENKLCHGYDLRNITVEKGFHLQWLLDCHQQFATSQQPTGWIKQNTFFDRLAGTNQLRQMIAEGKSEEIIRSTWQENLTQYRNIRAKYLLYP